MIRLYSVYLLLAFTVGSAAATHARAEVVLIKAGEVHVEPGKTLVDTSILIRNGKIAAIGKQLKAPVDATIIDAHKQVITAGFIESFSRVGVSEVDMVDHSVARAGSSGTEAVHASYNVSDSYNPLSPTIALARTGGITSTVVTPRGGFVAGQSAYFATDGTATTLRATTAIYATLGRNALGGAQGSRGRAISLLRELFIDAKQYGSRRAAYQNNKMRKLAASGLDLAALQGVLQRKVPLVITAHRHSDIRAAIKLAQELRIRIAIAGGTEAWTLAGDLRTAKIPVLVDPTANLPNSFDQIYVRDDNAARLAKAGVSVIITSLGSAANARNLRQVVGNAIAHGLSRKHALASVTSIPAQFFALKHPGTLKVGARADITIWSGDPFELSTQVDSLWIAGRRQSLRTRQQALLQRYRRTKK